MVRHIQTTRCLCAVSIYAYFTDSIEAVVNHQISSEPYGEVVCNNRNGKTNQSLLYVSFGKNFCAHWKIRLI